MSLALTALMATLVQVPAGLSIFSGAGVLAAVQEVLIGVAIGMMVSLAFEALMFAGQTISLSMGLGFATLVDPQRGAGTPVLGRSFLIFGTLTYLAINGHLVLLGTLAESFRTLPIGAAHPRSGSSALGGRVGRLCVPIRAVDCIAGGDCAGHRQSGARRGHAGRAAAESVRCRVHHHAAQRFLRSHRRHRRHDDRHFQSHRQRVGGRHESRAPCRRSALMAAEAENGGERTEEPSAKRLQDARERGQVPRSRELTTFASMIAGSGALVALGGPLAGGMSQLMRRGLVIDPRDLRDPDTMMSTLGQACLHAITILLPLFAALIGLIVLASVALGGWNFSPQALAADFSRLNPLTGLTRLFGMRGVSELGKALLKCIVVGAVCAAIVAWIFGDVLALGHMAPRAAIGRGAELTGWAFVWLCASLALIAVVDVPLQLFQFKRALRMTRQELRDEAKESDGRPETKQRIRRLQQQSARQRMMKEVPTADVIIVNTDAPLRLHSSTTRRACAHHASSRKVSTWWRRTSDASPPNTASPVFGAPKLARALYRSTDLNREIPSGLYVAVAQVLSYIFRVRTLNPTTRGQGGAPGPRRRRGMRRRMNARTAMGTFGGFARQGLGVPALVMVILAMMVLPLPAFLLDVFFTFNISLSIMILLAVIYVRRALEFATFPTVLLGATLLRLGLNVASTRVVLMNGHTGSHAAGHVIAAFGAFVVGGNYAVGLVVFIVLVIINFVVITKGAGRIAEVSARFTLDAMPGRQMAIDADLNAGIITQPEAITRRQEIREEAPTSTAANGRCQQVRARRCDSRNPDRFHQPVRWHTHRCGPARHAACGCRPHLCAAHHRRWSGRTNPGAVVVGGRGRLGHARVAAA